MLSSNGIKIKNWKRYFHDFYGHIFGTDPYQMTWLCHLASMHSRILQEYQICSKRFFNK